MILDRLKRWFKGQLPDQVMPLYKNAKDEREALDLLRAERQKDAESKESAMAELMQLADKEKDLFEKAKKETNETAKMRIVREIKYARQRVQDLNAKVQNIYEKRLRIFDEHIRAMELALEARSAPLPEAKSLEASALRAQEQAATLDDLASSATGLAPDASSGMDREEQDILRELTRAKDADDASKG